MSTAERAQAHLNPRLSRDERWLLDRGIRLERVEGSHRPGRVDGYDPERWAERFQARLYSDWRDGKAGTEPCTCPAPHIPPRNDELPAWPPHPRRGLVLGTHAWHRGTKRHLNGARKAWLEDYAIMNREFGGEPEG
jgi:hypothetical protein